VGSILAVLDANHKSQNFSNVMDNLNFAIDGMTRSIRFGQNYHCGSTGNLETPLDCSSGGSSLTVENSSGSVITYALSSGRISRRVDYGQSSFITPSGITIESLSFWVFGSSPYNNGSDLKQPRVIIIIKGYSSLGSNPLDKSSFTIETLASQRKLDIQ
jgi:hypothetical protein